jgi:hypothetical protein
VAFGRIDGDLVARVRVTGDAHAGVRVRRIEGQRVAAVGVSTFEGFAVVQGAESVQAGLFYMSLLFLDEEIITVRRGSISCSFQAFT